MSIFKKLSCTKEFKLLIQDFNNLQKRISKDFKPIYNVYYHYSCGYTDYKNKFSITPDQISETFLLLTRDFNDLYDIYLKINEIYHKNLKYLARKFNDAYNNITYSFPNYKKQIEQLMYNFRMLARENEEHKKYLIANHLIPLNHLVDALVVKLLYKNESNVKHY